MCQAYAAVTRIPSDNTADRPIKLEAQAATATCSCDGRRNYPCTPVSKSELETVPKQLTTGKSPGPDGTSNELLRQLSPTGKVNLPSVIGKSWTTAEVPAYWRTAEIQTSDSQEREIAVGVVQRQTNKPPLDNKQTREKNAPSPPTSAIGRLPQRIFDAFEQKKTTGCTRPPQFSSNLRLRIVRDFQQDGTSRHPWLLDAFRLF